MNERIKELVVESGNGQMRNGKLYPHIGSRTEEDWKKFAELIVREVLDQVDEFSRLTKAYQTQGIDPEIDVTKEVLKNLGFTRFPRS